MRPMPRLFLEGSRTFAPLLFFNFIFDLLFLIGCFGVHVLCGGKDTAFQSRFPLCSMGPGSQIHVFRLVGQVPLSF